MHYRLPLVLVVCCAVATALAGPALPTFLETQRTMPRPPLELVVYFPSDEIELLAESEDRLSRDLGEICDRPAAEIRITGHADREGGEGYNQALSEHRARAVQRLLLEAGCSGTLIQVDGRGETEPAVPTPEGTREARNRRVEIRVR